MEQNQSPWLLILRLHVGVVFLLRSYLTLLPQAQKPAHWLYRAVNLNRGWLHRVMGLSPPAGSLPAALLVCSWDWTEVSLSLTESSRYSLPSAVLWTDGPAWHLIWPSLIEEPGQTDKTERNKFVSSFSAHHSSTGGLGASSSSACLFPKAPSGKYSDHRIFNFQDSVWGSFTPSLLSRVRKGVENQKFYFTFIMVLSLSNIFCRRLLTPF